MSSIEIKTAGELQIELGSRLRQLRLRRNLDQRETAAKAGVSEKAVRNLEAGRGSTVETMLRVMKAIDALDGLQALAPEPRVDPLALLRQPAKPQRVRRVHRARFGESP